MLLVSESDPDLVEKVSSYCENRGISLEIAKDPVQLVKSLDQVIPDIILITDGLPGLEANVAAHLLKGLLDLRTTTMVLVTKDKLKLEGPLEEFNHRVFAPIDRGVLDNIVNIHKSSPRALMKKPKKSAGQDERRMDAIVRSKVSRILKSHSQLEEYYSTKVRELEDEIDQLKPKPGKKR